MRRDQRKKRKKIKKQLVLLIVIVIIIMLFIIMKKNNVLINTLKSIRQAITGAAQSETYVSELISNIEYNGTQNPAYELSPVLENEEIIYNDTSETFTSIPYRYLNAEYLKISNSDNSIVSNNLINFTALKNIDVLIFKDLRVKNPAWLDTFIQTEDIVTDSNGTIYKVYKKSFAEGAVVTLGSNGDTTENGTEGNMNIVAIKETSKVTNNIFFSENLESLDTWNYVIQENTSVIPEIIDNSNVFHFLDSASGKIAYIYKRFAKITKKFSFEYKIQIIDTLNNNPIANNYIRIFLHKGKAFTEINTKTNVNVETYISDSTKWSYRVGGTSTPLGVYNGIINNQWHTLKYDCDMKNEKFDLTVNGIQRGTNYDFDNSNLGYTNYVTFGTGNNSSNNFYIKDISIVPKEITTITGININGVALANFNGYTKDYLVIVENVPTVTITQGSSYGSSTITTSDGCISISVIDINGDSLNYKVYYMLSDIHINKTELRSVISQAESIKTNFYTTQSVQQLNTEIVNAKVIANKAITTENEVNVTIANLKAKIEALELK